jgi:osmoprotectant transport system ATP-binding protein
MTTPATARQPGPSSTPRSATLEFRNATKRYPGQERPAVESLSLTVPAGEICVLVGPSGCGKTTAMRMANRMTDITDGDILLDGESVRGQTPAELRRQIGYAIQQIGLFPHLSVADNIATVPRLLGWDRERIARRVDELLELTSLDPAETRDRFPAQLSGGQRQRVGVARALAADPPLMLMDEPFGAIDPINRERLQNEFLRLQAELRKTVVFVTHDIDEAIKMGDKIAVMQIGGRLAQYAAPAELLMYPADRFVEDFVGADRALKRLALQRVRDIDLWKAAVVRVGEPTGEVRRKVQDADLSIPLVVDEKGAPQGWLSERGMAGERITPDFRSPAEPVVELDDVLRDALADLLESETMYGPVIDPSGKVCGVLSLEVIQHTLHEPPEEVPHGADAALAAEEQSPAAAPAAQSET